MITQSEKKHLDSRISLAIGELIELKNKLDRFDDFSDEKIFSDFQRFFVESYLAAKNGKTIEISPNGSITYKATE